MNLASRAQVYWAPIISSSPGPQNRVSSSQKGKPFHPSKPEMEALLTGYNLPILCRLSSKNMHTFQLWSLPYMYSNETYVPPHLQSKSLQPVPQCHPPFPPLKPVPLPVLPSRSILLLSESIGTPLLCHHHAQTPPQKVPFSSPPSFWASGILHPKALSLSALLTLLPHLTPTFA